jgi:hypothetical protein
MKTTLIEKREQEAQYNMTTESMILDTDTHGRLLITDGWGGDDVNGYCYRWRHGLAIQIKTDDTFEVLDRPWNEWTDTINAVLTGNDPERPILDWNGFAIEKIAKRHQ